MAIRIILFNAALLGACFYALRYGGAPERVTAVLLLAAAALTAALPFDRARTFYGVDWLQVAVDGGLLVGLMAVAGRANRFWPLWLSAFHLLALAVHGVRAYDDSILPEVYNRLIGKVAYPMIALLAIGTWRHMRRVAAGKPERDWSPLVWW